MNYITTKGIFSLGVPHYISEFLFLELKISKLNMGNLKLG